MIYALKFVLRAESPRDYIDILLSMKHQPNIVISVVAKRPAAHGNIRQPDMFWPFRGMVAEPTEENINAARDGMLDFFFYWLHNPAQKSKSAEPTRAHPGNVRKEEKVLRRMDKVVQLRGHVNS